MGDAAEAERLSAEITDCTACAQELALTRTAHAPRPVLQFAPNARICVAGQAPGWRAHEARRPFDDPSGDRLREWLGVDRATFYDSERLALLPMGFCFPGHAPKGGDLPPPIRCAELWREKLFAVHCNLKLILPVGGAAQKWHLGAVYGRSVTETVRGWRRCYDAQASNGIRYLPLPHPSWRNTAWLRRNPWFEAETLPFLRECISELI